MKLASAFSLFWVKLIKCINILKLKQFMSVCRMAILVSRHKGFYEENLSANNLKCIPDNGLIIIRMFINFCVIDFCFICSVNEKRDLKKRISFPRRISR